MKIKLLKKVNARIKIIENGDKFQVQITDRAKGEWRRLSEYKKREDAYIQKYRYYRTFLLKDFGIKTKYDKKYNK